MAGMDDPSELQAGGVHLGGTKYMFIQSDDRLVAGKKVRFRRHRRETERRRFLAVGTCMKTIIVRKTAPRRANGRLVAR